MNQTATIEPAEFPRDVESVRALFREYAAGLGFDLDFQGFEDELASLPGKYSTPSGGVFIATKRGDPVGCVAFRPLKDGDCEMKRLYLRPAARGEQLGRRLAVHVCEAARGAGYRRICLDTIDSMRAAIALYESLGFREIAPYVFNPIAGAKYFAREL
jgi:ribosomal protein S18 acetylase RimI-like enzyme